MPQRLFAAILLICTAAFPVVHGGEVLAPVVPPAVLKTDPLLENIEGADADKGSLAARDLLSQIVDRKGPRSEEYLKYLRSALDPERIAKGPALQPVADRLVAALGYTASAGQQFPPEGADLLLKLIGLGSDGFRRAVRDAVVSFARAEQRSGGSRILQALAAAVQSEPAPVSLDEFAEILWRVNGKELLKALMAAVTKGKARPRSELIPYLTMLRDRLDLDLPAVEDWERWWTESQESPIEVILAAARQKARESQAELLRKILRRVADTLEPEAYLGGITDCLELRSNQGIRVAAVDALGALPSWLRDSKFPLDKNGVPILDDARKSGLASRGLALLLKVLAETDPRSLLQAKVRRSALVGLRGYAGHVEKNPADDAALGAAVLAAFRAIAGDPGGLVPAAVPAARKNCRDELLELLKTAGALRIVAARPYIEGILLEPEAAARSDVELIVEAIGALGRIQEKGVSQEPVELIMKWFRASREPSDKGQKDIRKACVAALNLRIEDRDLRREVRSFQEEILANVEDKAGHVPAILGLGTLAKAGDPEALVSLGKVLERRSEYGSTEAVAAIDAIAYLGGREAIQGILAYIDAKDLPFAEHVWRKLVNLHKGQSPDLLEWSLGRILDRAFKEDKPELARLALRLLAEPELAPLLSVERANSGLPGEIVAFWNTMLFKAQALEISGDDAAVAEAFSVLNDSLVKNGRMKSIRSSAEEELSQERLRLAPLADLRSALAKDKPADPKVLVRDLLGIIVAGDRPVARWRRFHWILAQIQGLKPMPESLQIVTELLAELGKPSADSLWTGLGPDARDSDIRARYLKALEALRDKLKAAPVPVSGN